MMMKRAIAFGLVALPACTTDGLGTTSQEIIGGQTTQSSDWKSVVALEDTPGQWFCTGTLITDQWVLTAAHCMEGETPAKLHVRFDTNDANNGQTGHAVAVAEIHSNPAFDYNAWDNDVALIKLAAPVTDRTPTPINRDTVSFGAQLIDVGYGVSDNNDGGGGILRKVSKVTADCAGANDPGIVNDNLLCFDASDGRILFSHIAPNVIAPALVVSSFQLAELIIVESSLSFLGLGVQPPTPSWGSMLSQGREYISSAWWLVTLPGLAIIVTVLGANLFGDAVRDALDPRLRGLAPVRSAPGRLRRFFTRRNPTHQEVAR